MSNIREMAQAHWNYVRSVLTAHGVPQSTILLIGFHYTSAFEHGYKHGNEDATYVVVEETPTCE